MRRLIYLLNIGLMSLLLSGCKYELFETKGAIAADEKMLLIVCVALMLLVVVPVIILTLVFAWRYRASNAKAKYTPDWSHSTLVEALCWSGPIIIIGILATITWISSHRLDPFKPLEGYAEKPLNIQVVALNWKWLFIYPEENIATINYVQFPVNRPVKFSITSEGTMNSFSIPQLAGQIYAMAGMRSVINIVANEMGDYRGFSANFSGNGFSDMKFVTHVGTSEEFNAWVKSVKSSTKNVLDMTEYNKLAVPSEKNPVAYYSSVNGSVFDNVVMKEMIPLNDVNLCNKKS